MFQDTFVTDGAFSYDDFHDMAEALTDIEDDEDILNEIVDDELKLANNATVSLVLDDADNEEEEVVLLQTSNVKKN